MVSSSLLSSSLCERTQVHGLLCLSRGSRRRGFVSVSSLLKVRYALSKADCWFSALSTVHLLLLGLLSNGLTKATGPDLRELRKVHSETLVQLRRIAGSFVPLPCSTPPVLLRKSGATLQLYSFILFNGLVGC